MLNAIRANAVCNSQAAAALWALLFAVAQRPALAQEPARPAFDVASIKPGDPNERRVAILLQPGGRLVTTNVSLKMLVGFAYNLRDHQISGGPNWLDSQKFNIEARAPEGEAGLGSGNRFPPDDSRIRMMLQSLLAERFHLAVHRETKEEPVYNLVIAKGGSKLKETPGGGPDKPRQMRLGRGQLIASGTAISMLIMPLSQQLGRSVIDKTGLAGRYDFTLQWAPDPREMGAFGPLGPDAPPPPDPNGPTIFTALQEQLGLRLESAKGPVEMLVIDGAEKPTEN